MSMRTSLLLCLAILSLSACSSTTSMGDRAVVGGTIGLGLGAITGNVGGALAGAAIGAAVGAASH